MTLWAAKVADPTSKPKTALYTLKDVILCGDIGAGTITGYASVHLYYLIKYYPMLAPGVGMMIWRELTLISVIGALVVARADLPPQDNAWSEISTAMVGVLSRAACAGTLLLCLGLVTSTLNDFARLWLVVWASLFVAWMCLSRLSILALRRYAARLRNRPEAIAVIGVRESISELLTRLARGARIVNVIDRSTSDGRRLAEALANVVSLARDGAISLIVLATGYGEPPEAIERIVDYLSVAPIRVALCSTHPSTTISVTEQTFMLAGVEMTIIADRPIGRRDMFIKTAMDRTGAILLVILSLPLLIAAGLAILAETGGPVIFKQSRNGWCGRLFTVYKFRTMHNVPGQHSHYQTQREDPRCTRVGSFLRRTSLDELPQLWNILRGDMSLVGPRPHADFMHARERMTCGPVADYAQRQRVKPGLTGWAQVHGLRGAADTAEKLRQRVEYDRYYIDNWSVWLDLKILIQTPLAIISKENAF
jgi:putative colanic acid biosynthesis UDP-glucose lipid carrier transferase